MTISLNIETGKMQTNFEKIKEFHTAFGIVCPTIPTLPDKKLRELRDRLVDEERQELHEGLDANDIQNVAKEICDCLVVLYGYAHCLGIDIDKAFAEVHRSNMSKLGPNGEVIKRADGKILKGPNYSPADMSVIWDGI